ncbi:MAG: UDP-glucose/GDP-mannose dehydrogenase family protein [Dactylosporangium sp.]|nr:UDP-glucose/GDP-mannose dehydrogenase family protein [Dactylosporangium sp.]NNJ60670.1 UDP-glucose/GDP-mannose dehydrogenase family protein [Dactylosporangium sp.]
MAFLGTGYLGATYAVCLAELGYDVLGFDPDASKIAHLAAGRVPFHEPGLQDLLRTNLAAGRLRFSTSLDEVAAFGDIHVVCVGTPQRAGAMAADLSQVRSAITNLVPRIRRKALIIGKSTVPVGTTAWIESLVADHADPGLGIEVAWSPEFLREGLAVNDVLRPDRVVFGVRSDWASAMLHAAHQGVFDLAAEESREVPVIVCDFATAELVKVAANAFLATKISFINAMAEVCEASGGDVELLAQAIGHDARIGRQFLGAGIGFGGGCLPKDLRAFQARAQELGVGEALRFLYEVDLINQRSRQRVVRLAATLLGCPDGPTGPDFAGTRIACLGATFKPDSDDVRDSPALSVIRTFAAAGAEVRVYDPRGTDNAREAVPEVAYAQSLADAVARADLLCVLTEWGEFREADPAALARLVRGHRVIDGRGCLDAARWAAAGWDHHTLGRRVKVQQDSARWLVR